MKFTLEIKLGNDAMKTGADVAKALRDVAKKVQDISVIRRVDIENRIVDLNGNKIGTWSTVEETYHAIQPQIEDEDQDEEVGGSR